MNIYSNVVKYTTAQFKKLDFFDVHVDEIKEFQMNLFLKASCMKVILKLLIKETAKSKFQTHLWSFFIDTL